MKNLYLLILSSTLFLIRLHAQISVHPSDTNVCPGKTYTISSTYATQWDKSDTSRSDDAFGEIVDIGFSFIFYGETYRHFVISPNNFISFDTGLAKKEGAFEYEVAKWNNQLDKVIMFPFQDLTMKLNQGDITYQMFGKAPNRRLVIDFCQVPLWGCVGFKVSDQLILYEGTNIIEMHIREKPTGCRYWGGTAIQGLRYKTAQSQVYEDIVPGRADTGIQWSAYSEAYRFTPLKNNTAYQVESIPFAPVPIIINTRSAFPEWYAEGNPNPIARASSIQVTADPNTIRYYVAKITGKACGDINTEVYTDTSWLKKELRYDTVQVAICGGQEYDFYGRAINTTGRYDSLFISSGCYDSVVVLDLLVYPIDTQTVVKKFSACTQLELGGVIYTSDTVFADTLLNRYGCDSLYQVTSIKIYPEIPVTTINKTICQGQSYTQKGVVYTSGVNITDTFKSINNCDSLVHLTLTVDPYLEGILDTTICFGESVIFNGKAYDSTVTLSDGIKDTVKTKAGCDSIISLVVHVVHYFTGIQEVAICQGKSYDFNGKTYTSSVTLADSITDTIASSVGCDSIVSLVLHMSPLTTLITKMICPGDSVLFNDEFYYDEVTEKDGVKDTFVTDGGCDSIVTLILKIRQTITTTLSRSICPGGSFVFNGVTYTSAVSGVKATFKTAGGCDSIVTLNLKVNSYPTSVLNASICEGDSLEFNGRFYKVPVPVSQGVKDTVPATNGCYSIVSLNLKVLSPSNMKDTLRSCGPLSFNGKVYDKTTLVLDTFAFKGFNCDSVRRSTYIIVYPLYAESKTVNWSGCGEFVHNGNTYRSDQVLYDTLKTQYGCDSIYRTINLTVHPPIPVNILDTMICEGRQVFYNGSFYSRSVSLTDTLNSKAGCDSIIGLKLTVVPYLNTVLDTSICEGQSLVFSGITYTRSVLLADKVTDTFPSVSGCDSIVSLSLKVHPIDTLVLNERICSGSLYELGTQQLFLPGTYVHTFTSRQHCDSVVIVNLSVDSVVVKLIDTAICEGETFFFAGLPRGSSGIYLDKRVSAFGCDSILELHLDVIPLITNQVEARICEGTQYFFGRQVLSLSGTYKETFRSVTGCDSIVTLDLTVDPITYGYPDVSICFGDFYEFRGEQLYVSGTYYDTLTNVYGCDSIVQLRLSVVAQIITPQEETICHGESYSFGGQLLSVAGTYFDTLQSAFGCDSIIKLDLTILPAVVSVADTTAHCWIANFRGEQYTANTTVTDTFRFSNFNCDSVYAHHYILIHPADTQSTVIDLSACGEVSFEGKKYSASTAIADTLYNKRGCDSLYRFIDIEVIPIQPPTIINATICSGEKYLFAGQEYSRSGSATKIFADSNGCDSTVVLNLNVLPPTPTVTDTFEACWSLNYKGNTYNSSILIRDTLKYANFSCDSVYYQAFILIRPVDTQREFIYLAECDRVVFENKIYTSSVRFGDTLRNRYQCDSVYREIDITVFKTPLKEEYIAASGCEVVVFEGQEYFRDTTLTTVEKDENGCDSFMRKVNIAVHPIRSGTLYADICVGESYTFHDSSYSEAGDYFFVLTSTAGCDSFLTLTLNVHPLPELSILHNEKPYDFCRGDEVLFYGKGAETYHWKWQDSNGWEYGGRKQIVLPDERNTVWMKGTDTWGCVDSTSIQIDLEACCEFLVPNAFSPNGDGLNDGFRAETSSHPISYQLLIFNRYGQEIFNSSEVREKWDGTFLGRPSEVGTYYYFIKARCVDGTIWNKKGDFLLIR